jgi:lipopolysaccharide biosynthesis protein
MKHVTQTHATQSKFGQANAAFRNQDYASAIDLYDEAITQADEALKARIRFNRDMAMKKLRSSSKNITTQAFATILEKPDGLDLYYFEMIQQGNFFASDWYLAQYKEKHKVTGNPLEHYLDHGVALSTNPSLNFDTAYYIKTYQDVAQSGMHPFVHYVCQGHKEARQAKPPADEDYLDIYKVAAPVYMPRLALDTLPVEKAVRVIAFYLPQFHAIPENDVWWGKGFTEWSNVRPAQPQFEGHYQPHEPDDFLGYYDLSDTSVIRKQIDLAKQYGIEGFCFYTYWFSGARLLETPVDSYLADATLDLPFCICWANENWSRRWDGLDNDLLMVQHYSEQDDTAFIAHMAKYLRDSRYIRIQGKPLLIVYRPNLFPSMEDTANRWRGWCRDNGLGEIYIAYVQSFEKRDPTDYGLDAAIEFPPNNSAPPDITDTIAARDPQFSGKVYDWRTFVQRSDNYAASNYTVFRGACPSWDNTARKKGRGTVFKNSCPALFEQLLVNVFSESMNRATEMEKKLVFINAWNEWAEGAHLEPDRRYGYAWLQAVRNANQIVTSCSSIRVAVVIHAYYPEILNEIMEKLIWMDVAHTTLYITTSNGSEEIITEILNRHSFKYSITTLPNRGRDILPFLKILPRVLSEGAQMVLKLHTKKSPHRVDGERWRQELFHSLLEKSFLMKTKLALISDEKFGLSAPADHVVPMSYYWGSNCSNVENLCRRVGWSSPIFDEANFVAGTMFIAGKALLKDLLDLGLNDSDFEEEAGQVDGTMAHAVERMIGFICHKNNYKIVKYGNSISNKYKYAAASV